MLYTVVCAGKGRETPGDAKKKPAVSLRRALLCGAWSILFEFGNFLLDFLPVEFGLVRQEEREGTLRG